MVSPTQIDRLIAGFKSFKATYYEQRPERFQSLVERGQNPRTLVIACSDSRADPAILTNSEPGELFVIRNVASLVPPYQPEGRMLGTSSAIEFAVRDLAVRHIVVLGHSNCGGIEALQRIAKGEEPQREFLANWVSIACEASNCKDKSVGDANEIGRQAVVVSLTNLKTFPWIAEPHAKKELSLHGWWFDMGKGALWAYNEFKGAFEVLA
ncbi:MAG: carbonic anhydrase [Alphaproteobacteria bacterium]|nr:carbonic anhydrase [Alphaproteobacteria bacterium]